MAYNKRKALVSNILAIDMAYNLKKEGRKATEIEMLTLKGYSGFGGIREILVDPEKEERWDTPNKKNLLPLVKRLHQIIQDNTDNDVEKKMVIQSLKESSLTAFYTPEDFITSVGKMIREMTGSLPQKMLEPSAGTGRFMHLFDEDADKHSVQMTAYELDQITGTVLTALEPEAKVRVAGFETIPDEELGTYDLIVSNIPFGNFQVNDMTMSHSKDGIRRQATKRIHNYFFVKGLDALKEGGLMVYLTTRNVAETDDNKDIREYMVRHADLVSGIRLYDDTFREEGIYEIGTDLLIFQKNSKKQELSQDELDFIETQDYELKPLRPGSDEMTIDLSKSHARNKYFNKEFWYEHTEDKRCLGYPNQDLDRFGKDIVSWSYDDETYPEEGDNIDNKWWELEKMLRRDFARNWRKPEPQLVEPVKPAVEEQVQPERKPDNNVGGEQMTLWDLFGFTEEERSQVKQTGRRKPRSRKPANNPSPKVEMNWAERKFEAKGLPYARYGKGTVTDYEGQIGVIDIREDEQWFVPSVNLSEKERDILYHYCTVRNAYWHLFDLEQESQLTQDNVRKRLNDVYETMVQQVGDIRSASVAAVAGMDPHYSEVAILESYVNGLKVLADIFREPVIFKSYNPEEDDRMLEPAEALGSSLNIYAEVNMDFLMERTGLNEQQLVAQLRDQIYYNPEEDRYEHAGRMIAGNIYRKIDTFRDAMDVLEENLVSEYETGVFRFNEGKRTLEVLERNIPKKVPYEELDFNLGERWIEDSLYSRFATELNAGAEVNVTYMAGNDSFLIKGQYNYKTNLEWGFNTGHFRKSFTEMLLIAMEDNIPDFKYKTYDGDYMVDEEAVQLCSSKVEALKQRFQDFLEGLTVQEKDALADRYNRLFNAIVKPHYDGSCQTFPGLTFENFDYDELYPSQKDAIWMIKQNNGGICDHQVGAGKTMIMCVAAQEMKRLGLAHKPMIIALKANVHEIAGTYRKAYPQARILYPTKEDFAKENRVELFRRIQNNNYDCVIISHDQFKMIPQSKEVQRMMMYEELEDVERSLHVMEEQNGRYASARQYSGMETRRKNLKAKIEQMNLAISLQQDDEVDFRSMGIDHIFVDECHKFKNLGIVTRHSRVAGLGDTRGSQRSSNMLVALRDIQMRTGRDLGATFLSGTTISNSLTELYVLFKYLRPQALKDQGINCFDAWAAIYTRKSVEFEFNVTNQIVQKERFRYFVKVPELALFYNEITDYRTADMIGIDRPEKNSVFVNIPLTPEQEAYLPLLMDFANGGSVDQLGSLKPPSKNEKARMLLATNYSNKMALDLRLINPYTWQDMEGGKVDVAAARIAEYYRKYDEHKGTQFVFSDLGVYAKDEWNIYSAIKDRLVEQYGIPEKEIAFIQENKYSKEENRAKLFQQMNDGEVRVLFGSTEKLGTGVNAQKRAVALHHLDTPWRPSDLEQREGRAVRKGNEVAKLYADNKVDVVTYATERSLDAYKFNILQNKQNFITQLKNNQLGTRTLDEGAMDEATGVSFAEYVAVLSGNTDLLDLAKLDKRIMQLEKEKVLYNRESLSMERSLATKAGYLEENRVKQADLKKDHAYFKQHESEGFVTRGGERLEPKEMVKYIRDSYKRMAVNSEKVLGTFAGGTVKVGRYDYRSELGVTGGVSGRVYYKASGTVPKSNEEMERYFHDVFRSFPDRAEELKRFEALYIKEIEQTTVMLKERAWPKESELQELKQQHRALDEKIKADLKKVEEKKGQTEEEVEDAVVVEENEDFEDVVVVETGEVPVTETQPEKPDRFKALEFEVFEECYSEKDGWGINTRRGGDDVFVPLDEEEKTRLLACTTEEETEAFLESMIDRVLDVYKAIRNEEADSSLQAVSFDINRESILASRNGVQLEHKLSNEEMRTLAGRKMTVAEMAEKVFAEEKKETRFTDIEIVEEKRGLFTFRNLKCKYDGIPMSRSVTRNQQTMFLNRELDGQKLCESVFPPKILRWYKEHKAQNADVKTLTEESTVPELLEWYGRLLGKEVTFHFDTDNLDKVYDFGTVTEVVPSLDNGPKGESRIILKYLNPNRTEPAQMTMDWADQSCIRLKQLAVEEKTAEQAVQEEHIASGFKR